MGDRQWSDFRQPCPRHRRPGAQYTITTDINNHGQIVGAYTNPNATPTLGAG